VGAEKVVGIWLRVADEVVGLLMIQPGQVNDPLLNGISAQIAIAIANVKANEEIHGREFEKSRLLAFSNTIAAIREIEELAIELKQQLKELFNIQDYVIHALSKDKKSFRPLLFDSKADFAKHPDYRY
jgi:K+-sensing histidine kinase KdpD